MTDERKSGGLDRLREGIKGVRTRRGGVPLDRAILIAGAVAIALGIPLIIMGWYGASHTPYVFEQVPYLISGGLLGLALAIVGGLFYFSYWLTKQVQETRRQGEEARAALARVEKALVAGVRGETGPAASNGSLVATKTGTMIHRPTCVVVAHRKDLRRVAPDEPGFEPCKICDPLGAQV